jgi:hypothetical protein
MARANPSELIPNISLAGKLWRVPTEEARGDGLPNAAAPATALR